MPRLPSFCELFFALSYFCQLTKTLEPVCSQCDCDRKLLENMVETNHKVKEMEKNFRRSEEHILAILEYRRVEMQNLSKDLKNVKSGLENITDELESLRGRVDNVELPKVAFSAYNPVDKNLQTKETFVLQSVLINEGNGYDTKTGIFTAPINGLYHFTAHLCNKVDYVIHYAIVLNDEWIARSQQFEENDVNPNYGSCGTVSV
ncbi:heavy metal-binding protein HIP-like [Mercenaria mercenaria]|uniref:heavy metal-binding protein HIP-like n=1 Tax=Mercenaria mercenaria TaxID=6596 RepID=UPI00234E8C12|nr:heavy metal-binding protein HIP-like [Mercenaria mercenaria]